MGVCSSWCDLLPAPVFLANEVSSLLNPVTVTRGAAFFEQNLTLYDVLVVKEFGSVVRFPKLGNMKMH